MAEIQNIAGLSQALHWRPIPIWDPVPDWLISRLDKAAVIDLARIQLDLGINVLKAQMDAAKKAQEVIGRVK